MTTTTTPRPVRTDLAHHHPRVRHDRIGGWSWECGCGGASLRSATTRLTWHQAVVGALLHSASISP